MERSWDPYYMYFKEFESEINKTLQLNENDD